MNKFEDNLIWVKDNEGKEYLCTLNSECNETLNEDRELPRKFEELSMCERVSCRDVEEALGVEWW
jgi:hypothetical protein